MSRYAAIVVALGAAVLACSCVGTTGSALVAFPAYVAGPSDADPSATYRFTSGRGFDVELDLAVVHIGGIYLNRTLPVSGAQETSCVLPAQYVAELSAGLDVDAISPRLQPLPIAGSGTETHAASGEVWLTTGDVNAPDDPTPIVSVHGWATRDGATHEFRGTLTIGANRAVAVRDPSRPGANPICKQRIVSPIPVDLTPHNGGALIVRVDPKTWFANVDFDTLEADVDGALVFADENKGQASLSLFQGLRATEGAYVFSWNARAPEAPLGRPMRSPLSSSRFLLLALPWIVACGADTSGPAPVTLVAGAGGAGDAHHTGGGGAHQTVGAGGGDSGALPCPVAPTDVFAPAILAGFVPPDDPGAGGVTFSISGERLAVAGYGFPPIDGAPSFVDGWKLTFTRLLATVDAVTLYENPDKDPGDPSKTDAAVAQVNGPWAVDLHQTGAVAGKGGGGETAIAIASIASQNLAGGAAFDPTARYAFGFRTVAATASAKNVNLDAAALADYGEMIARGYAVLYVGTATFEGSACTPSSPVFDALPKKVHFRLGFATPTSYLNCQNPDNDPAKPFAGEEHLRGIQVHSNAAVLAQITLHSDHPFWDAVTHDSPAHFDPIAAQYTCLPPEVVPVARVEDLAGVDLLGFRDRAGRPLPWRSCVGADFIPPDDGMIHFDPKGIPLDPSNQDGTKLRDYADYLRYNQSTQGHLNADGLCFVRRNYPSPR